MLRLQESQGASTGQSRLLWSSWSHSCIRPSSRMARQWRRSCIRSYCWSKSTISGMFRGVRGLLWAGTNPDGNPKRKAQAHTGGGSGFEQGVSRAGGTKRLPAMAWRLSLGLVLLLSLLGRTLGACPNSCSFHGTCDAGNVCICEDGWDFAPDCSLRKYGIPTNI